MLAAIAFRPHYRAHLFTGIFGIEVIEQITERRKIVAGLGAIHAAMDSNEANIIARKNKLRVLSDL